MKSKTIIISAPEENNTRGILSLFQEDDLLKCRLRVYNLQTISRFCKLGIYHENEVYSANLIQKNSVYESSFVGNFDIDKDFYVALIDTSKNNQVLLAGGTYQGFYFNDNSVFLDSENFLSTTNQKYNNQLEIEEKKNNLLNENISKNEDCTEDCNKCAKCKYKEFFYSHTEEFSNKNVIVDEVDFNKIAAQNVLEKTDDDIETETLKNTEEQKQKVEQLINSIIPQFDNLFASYEQDKDLNSLIENSKFVKICENGEQFSIGAIYEENQIKFICYAVKKETNINPPKELGENYQWLPLDVEDPLSEGYYIVFQDASDLKIIKI